jgi:1A family penicillin-binding protein
MNRKLLATVLGAGLLTACGGGGECPSVEALQAYEPPQATRVFAADGSRLADLSPERRVVVNLDEVPVILSGGFVAVEDRRFWQHGGVDARGIGRAVWRGVRNLSMREGFSTITMQLTRNVFPEEMPRSERFRRKVCEVRLARQVEDALSKREILRMYVNQVYMGDGLYGVEEAARAYFGKPVGRASVAEAALLVGLVKNPEGYNPRKNPARAIQRRNVVLDVMAREGVIEAAAASSAKAEPLRLAAPLEAAGPAPYAVAAVRRELREIMGAGAEIKGMRVHTALDPGIQRAAHAALVEQIRKVEAGQHGTYSRPVPNGRLTPAEGSGSPYLQGMVIVLDTRTGGIRALVGGRDFTHSSYDRALLARRQPGSAFKPIVYAAALQRGLATSTVLDASPITLGNSGSAVWRPDDLVSDTITALTARDAMALSSNYAAIRVGEWAGVQNVSDLARTLGLSTQVPHYPSIYLGAAEVIPVEFAAAYATLANGGHRVRPRLITHIEDAHGKVLWRMPEAQQLVLDPAVAFLATSIMEDVVDRGTGRSVRTAGYHGPAAGKTGTTNGARDVWFVGSTPDLTAAVWLGFDQPQTIMPNATGGRLAAPVWGEIMKAAYEKRALPAPWAPPHSVTTVAVDRTSGGMATANCPPENVSIEFFIVGREPAGYCHLHPESGLDRSLRGLWRRITGGDGQE